MRLSITGFKKKKEIGIAFVKSNIGKNYSDCVSSNDNTIFVLIKFAINGIMRHLSHAETLRVFQRACIRAQIKVQFSKGFNPRPKVSLPLPRTVGLETQDDLLTLKIDTTTGYYDMSDFFEMIKNKLSEQLPDGIKLGGIEKSNSKKPIQPEQATYIIALTPELTNKALHEKINGILNRETINITRTDVQKGKTKIVNIRDFIKSISFKNNILSVDYLITNAGSIRLDEIMTILNIEQTRIKGPVRRTNALWV